MSDAACICDVSCKCLPEIPENERCPATSGCKCTSCGAACKSKNKCGNLNCKCAPGTCKCSPGECSEGCPSACCN
ncbi:DgyrCDS3865 [Dimorphilus gyrociliatus]|uniref:DgyrCDS3865 n=1 Tax=Dimorphilus gyrociliatus TaxID=2664684 RepID=A0A7I8VEM3_9ANNE|nr:DgyrCDS3865 [Dimorphilus gyrociliatus]